VMIHVVQVVIYVELMKEIVMITVTVKKDLYVGRITVKDLHSRVAMTAVLRNVRVETHAVIMVSVV